jgi:RHS repeat-associated protein
VKAQLLGPTGVGRVPVAASTQSLTFNAANQVTNSGFTYDGTGNLTADGSGTYSYNGAQQMSKVSNSKGNFDYKYAGTNQVEVLQQESNERDYKLVYGRTNQVGLPIVEQVQAGDLTAYIENDPVTGEPLMLRSSSGVETLYVYDGLGSPVAMLTDYSAVAYAYTFDPYGTAVLSDEGTGGNGQKQNPFLFKGGIQDRATGWVHYGNRWYNTALGRWTQQDTLDAPLDATNANRYAYAGADPINNVDPTGRAVGSDIANGVFSSYFGAVVGFVVSGTCFGLATGAAIPTAGASLGAYVGCGSLGFIADSAFGSLIEGPFW